MLLVVLAHLDVPGFSGGFVGVDVFFVVSGFLITSLLAAEYAEAAARGGRGSISIVGFYARRARRILPAALTVIVAVVVAGGVLLNELRVAQIRHDAVWARLLRVERELHPAGDRLLRRKAPSTSPFQHYWSLAVEEQFYLVWPVLFLLVARLTFFGAAGRWRARVAHGRLHHRLRFARMVGRRHGARAGGRYFSTFTRAWELALGALIGIATTSTTELPRRLARAMSAAGVGLLPSRLRIHRWRTPYPGGAALLPTTATALLIVGGLAVRPPLPNRALSLAPLRFLGRISYSVYLWHWPIILFAAALYPTASKTVQIRLLMLLVTLAVATLSFYLVERPGRRIGADKPVSAVLARVRWRGGNLAKAAVGACVLVAVFVGPLSAIDREARRPERVASAAISAA